MKQMLNSRIAIQKLVETFYTRVRADNMLGPIFNNAENFSWDTHIPVMVNFWETMLLNTMSYSGNPMAKHIELHKRTPLNQAHFDQWKKLFFQVLDEHFEGANVPEAKRRVEAMAPLMLYKMEQSEKKGFIQ